MKLTEREINDLREGKKVFIEGMISNRGKEFDAHIQVNAERRGIEYIFENDKLFNRQSLGGVELTQKQIEDLNAGKAIFVEGMERKDGEVFSSYVKLDETTGRPSYTRYNPDSPEGAREIYIPNEIGGVKVTPEEQQQLREGKVIFLNDMVNRKGEEFSSFIKADLETGRLSYSRTPDGFEQRAEFKIPAKVWDVELNRKQRADLQSGKAVLVEGIKATTARPSRSTSRRTSTRAGWTSTMRIRTASATPRSATWWRTPEAGTGTEQPQVQRREHSLSGNKMNVKSKKIRNMNMNDNGNTPFKAEDVNWDELAGIGILKDELEMSGELDTLLKGEKTKVMSLSLVLLGVDVVMDATLQLVRKDGEALIEILASSLGIAAACQSNK